jgi:hypothetical protein
LGLENKCEARLWRVADGEPLGPLFFPQGYGGLSFSPDGLMVLTVGYNVDTMGNHVAQVWDVETSKPIGAAQTVSPGAFRYDARTPYAKFSPDGLSVVSQAGT